SGFGSGNLTFDSTGRSSAFVIEVSPALDHVVWADRLGSDFAPSVSFVQDLAQDKNGGLYATGAVAQGPITFDGTRGPRNPFNNFTNGNQSYVLEVHSDGSLISATPTSGARGTTALNIASSKTGFVVALGVDPKSSGPDTTFFNTLSTPSSPTPTPTPT